MQGREVGTAGRPCPHPRHPRMAAPEHGGGGDGGRPQLYHGPGVEGLALPQFPPWVVSAGGRLVRMRRTLLRKPSFCSSRHTFLSPRTVSVL